MTGKRGTLEERYARHVDRRGPDECWPWTGATHKGYGVIGIGSAIDGTAQAHRVGYELHHGEPVPAGMVLDHECHNRDSACPGGACSHRACQNPAHLIPRTIAENTAASPHTIISKQASTPPCRHGHAPANGRCRECVREYQREYDATRRKGGTRERDLSKKRK